MDNNFVGVRKNSKEYKSWCKIKERCFNPNSNSYKNYGAKGITLGEEYVNDFLKFYEEVGKCPGTGRYWSIDRIDNTKGYVKGNMQWSNMTLQSRNKGAYSNNKTGFTGVQWYPHSPGALYAVATWGEFVNGVRKVRNKKFSTKKLGLLPAFAMACKYRESKIAELNALGYGYTENHGK